MLAGLWLEQLTWEQAGEALRTFGTTLLPVGARTKEHGLHLPLNSDWLTVEYLARRLVERLPVVALPTLPYGFYPAFLDYPGSISVRLSAFRDTVIDICWALARHGAHRCYVLNNGISTNRGLEPARLALDARGITMEYTDLHRLVAQARQSIAEQPEGGHADELETSLLLVIAPEVVKLERARRDIPPGPRRGRLHRERRNTRGHYSPSGAWGDPTLATAAKGRALLRQMEAALTAEIRDFMAPGFRPAPPRREYLYPHRGKG